MEIGVFLGGLALCASQHTAPGYKAGELFLLKTPMTEGHLFNFNMFAVSYRLQSVQHQAQIISCILVLLLISMLGYMYRYLRIVLHSLRLK